MRRGNIIANLDWITIMLYLLLVIMGWLNIFSAVYSEGHPSILDINQRYGKQFIWILAAIIMAIAIVLIDHRFYEFFGYILYGTAILILLAVLVAGKEINGSKSWFALGGFQIQPSEFAKPAVALALAKYLSTFNINSKKFSTLLKVGIIIFLPSLLILLQPDTGSALVFFAFVLPVYREGFSGAILIGMFALALLFILVLVSNELVLLASIIALGFIAYWLMVKSFKNLILAVLIFIAFFFISLGASYLFGNSLEYYPAALISMVLSIITYLILAYIHRIRKVGILMLVVAATVFYTFAVNYSFDHFLSDYQQRRVNIMLGIQSDPLGAGYNVNQSMIAIGSGGVVGKGFLQGTQTKLNFVPEQSTDFIFCTVGEEWGFLGTTIVIILFLYLFIRLITLAELQKEKFARVFGYGLVSVMFLHFFINIAMTIGLFPVVGIPLPFFSYGGSSLWAFTIFLFIFLRLDAGRKE
ncbi:MAG: rod shape-determining protein RodA [Bacteroidales bacterium]|nr:rod shape-determining protein RodA [Bacteroidales bacterium]